jgi:hypothetical protein
MLGILKIGFIPKIVLVCIAAAGGAYLAQKVVAPAPTSHADGAQQGAREINSTPRPTGALHALHAKINATSPFLRIIMFAAVALLLPFALISLVRKVLAEKSNKYNFIMLAAFTVFDFSLAVVLVGILLTDFWAYLFIILAFIASALYNLAVLTRIEEMENG